MITVVYCTREHNQAHTDHIIKTCGLDKGVEVIEIINHGEALTKAYNRGLEQAKNDIVIFMHDDADFETNGWGNKLIKHFDKNPEFGIIGVAGTKNMPVTGRWWDNRYKMYGRVNHSHEGKKWLSAYSEDISGDIEETIIVDGLFFAVHKNRIKSNFDEDFNGFHFYDISFSFKNHISGCKVGVITNIRLTHKSIGMTNDEWERNRLLFLDKYSKELPIDIRKTNFKHKKLKVLIGCLSFTNLTGSELYVFELAKELVKNNCDVTVVSNIGNPVETMAKQHGIKVASLNEPPNYKMGDGKWSLNTQNGPLVSEAGKLYKISDDKFDIVHANHKPITDYLLKLYPDNDFITTIHSEVISLEEPIISNKIKKYIAIRPEIKEHLINEYKISEKDIVVIYNPIDTNRFKIVKSTVKKEKERILFVGTIDYLRKDTIKDLITTTRNEDKELWIVGKKNDKDNYLEALMINEPHVKYFEPTFGVEKFIHQCDVTAGILLGRTTIEGWLCGKKGWIYDVDDKGTIKGKTLSDIPEDIDKFKADNIAKQIIEEYKKIV